VLGENLVHKIVVQIRSMGQEIPDLVAPLQVEGHVHSGRSKIGIDQRYAPVACHAQSHGGVRGQGGTPRSPARRTKNDYAPSRGRWRDRFPPHRVARHGQINGGQQILALQWQRYEAARPGHDGLAGASHGLDAHHRQDDRSRPAREQATDQVHALGAGLVLAEQNHIRGEIHRLDGCRLSRTHPADGIGTRLTAEGSLDLLIGLLLAPYIHHGSRCVRSGFVHGGSFRHGPRAHAERLPSPCRCGRPAMAGLRPHPPCGRYGKGERPTGLSPHYRLRRIQAA